MSDAPQCHAEVPRRSQTVTTQPLVRTERSLLQAHKRCSRPMMSPELLSILRCPKCKGLLHQQTAPVALACPACQLAFSVDDGIPNMLIEDARPLAESAAP